MERTATSVRPYASANLRRDAEALNRASNSRRNRATKAGDTIRKGFAGGALGGSSRGIIQEGAVVVTVAVNVAGLPPFGIAEAGESVQTASDGAPVQVSVTVPLNPLMGVTCKL